MKTKQQHKMYDDTPRADERHWRKLEDDSTLEVDPAADLASNELVDGGNECMHCHRVIAPGQYVRRTTSGGWQHEECPSETVSAATGQS